MKKLFIIAILCTMPLFQNCGMKEKQAVTATPKDSIATDVTKTVIIDSTTTVKSTEIIVEDLSNKAEKTSNAKKLTTSTKVTAKKIAKVVMQTKTETKASDTAKIVVVVTDQTNKASETQPIVKLDIKNPTITTSGWVVPTKYISMKNPTDAKVDAAIGKSLFTKHCKACHGAKGLGDGTKAPDLKGNLGDFSSKAFKAQTDGELFYKMTFGKGDMPNFDKKLTEEEDRWLIINYIRTLNK